MRFPQDLLRFFYWIFFQPRSLHLWIDQLDPTLGNVSRLMRAPARTVRPLRNLVLFDIFIIPSLLAFGTGVFLFQLGKEVNWLKLALYLATAIALSLTFNVHFCIAFLLPFSVMVAIWSSNSFSFGLILFFSLMLGLAYGLNSDSARWGLTAGLVYGVLFGILLDPFSGLAIGAAFLLGYFRMIFYLLEAPLSWSLGILATNGDALKLWRFHPVLWDELIWFPLPRLDQHLLALKRQNGEIPQTVMLQVQESFRQRWATERIWESE